MHSRKSVGPRMDLLATLALTGYSFEDFHPEPLEGCSLSEKKNAFNKITIKVACLEILHKATLLLLCCFFKI